MEQLLLLLALLFSKLNAPAPEAPSAAMETERDPLEVVWSALYPALSASARDRDPNASYLPEGNVTLEPAALYATNRTVWRNFLRQQTAAADSQGRGEESAELMEALGRVRARLAERLHQSALIVLRADTAPDVLSPAAQELATAYMDMADLDIPITPPPPKASPSPLLRSYFALYAAGAGQAQWKEFSQRAMDGPFRDALHLAARVPRDFLGQAYTLLDRLGPPADVSEAEQRVIAREFVELRMRLAGM